MKCISKHFKLHHWPGLTFGLFIFTFLLTYLLSVLNGHVYGFFPYISDTGALIPESCIFGQLFNCGAIALGVTLYIRYRQIDFEVCSGELDIPQKWNTASLWLAAFISIGISMVGNFQETGILAVHLLGALLTFGLGSSYFLIQTRISYADLHNPKTNFSNPSYRINKTTFYLRVFLSGCLYPLLLVCGITSVISRNEFRGKEITWWTEKDGGFQVRLASTFTEWILVIFMLLYILTFTNEFKALEFDGIRFLNRNINLKNGVPDALDGVSANC